MWFAILQIARRMRLDRHAMAAVRFLIVVGLSFGASSAVAQSSTDASASLSSAREYAVSKAWLKNPVVPIRTKPPLNQKRIKLLVDKGAASGDGVHVLGTGIPLREGQARSLDELGIEGSKEGPSPAVFTKRTVWPDGSLQWVWADFQGRVDQEYELTIGQKSAPSPTPGMQVTDGNDQVVVNNGLSEIRWDRRFATPVGVSLIGSDGKLTEIAVGDGRGIYFIDQNGRRSVLGGDQSELAFEVESTNALRTVLRLEGWYVGRGQAARAIVRYHLYWNQPWMKVEHTFIVTKDNDEQWYKEIGIQLPLQQGGPAEVRFGVRGAEAVGVKLEVNAEASIFQDRYPLYHKKASHFGVHRGTSQVAEGAVAAGWTELHDGAANLLVAVKDFAPQFPAELSARANGVTAKLWSGRDGRVLDYKPATLARDWWGEWLDRLDYSRDQIRAKQRMAAAGKDSDFAYFTREQITALDPGCVGVARTHTLLAAWHSGAADPARAAALHALLERPPVVQPDPRWMCHVDSRVMTPMIAHGEAGGENEVIERGIAAWLGELDARRQVFPYTGWYEWGKHPNLGYERADDGTVYAQWYRLTSNNPYYYNLNMMLTWMRGGDRDYLEETERVNRWLADNEYIHWSGGRDKKRRGHMFNGHTRAPVYWTGSGSLSRPSTEAVTAFVYEYLLRDSRRLADLFPLLTDAYLEDFNFEYQETADMTVMTMAALYRVNQDPRLLDKMRQYVRRFTDPDSPTGLRESFWKTPANLIYKSHRKCYMLVQYHDLTGDDEIVPIIVKLAIAMFDHYNKEYTQPFYYQHRHAAIGARVYEWTRDPDMLFWARQQVAGAAEVFARYFQLPTEEKGAARGRKTGSFGAFVFKDVSYQADWMPGQGYLVFNLDPTPAIVSLPIALEVLRKQPSKGEGH